MSKLRILCTIDRAMGFGDAVMAHSTLKELSERFSIHLMCPDAAYNLLKTYSIYGINVFNVSQQGHFYHNDFYRSYNLIYWDVFNSLRQFPHHAINMMRELGNLELFTKYKKEELPELPIDTDVLSRMKLVIDSLKKPIILVHPLISYWNKMLSFNKYKFIVSNLSKLGTVLQIGTSVSNDLISDKGINLIGKTSLQESLALIKLADVIFCGDTFIQHASATLKTPSVVYFCGTAPMEFGYPFFTNIFNPDIVPCQVRCARPMRWLYDYNYSDKDKWNTRGESGWTCPVKYCEEIIDPDDVVSKVENELKIGRDRDWSFYDVILEDILPC